MNKIEEIVDLYNLKEQREKLIKNKEEISHLKKLMSDLKINRNVAIYAYATQKMILGEEIDSYLNIVNSLKDDSNVQEYISLARRLYLLEREKINYYRSIQIGLRNRLTYQSEPDIYVYYGMFEEDPITKNIVSNKLAFMDKVDTVVFPSKELKSNRKLRHFYNKTSFKYLEELSKDNSYSLEEKNLGKIRVLRK